jgi:chromosome partitioning protein
VTGSAENVESAQAPPVPIEAESVDSPTDSTLEPPRAEPVPEEPSPIVAATEPATPEAEPPFIPPLPKNPNLSEEPLDEPAPVVSLEAEPALEVEAPVEPARGATARAGTDGNFTERAQMAIGRLAELPATNGAHKTRALPRVVAIANQKGGVGKTTTTVNLGAALSELDYRVLVVDLDPQGNATSGLGIDTRNFEASMYDVIMRDAPIEDCIEPTSVQNLFVTPATIDLAGVEIELVSAFSRELKLKRAIDTVVDDFDFILIDCPPSLGLLTVNGLAAATEVLVPIQCEYYALEGLSQLLRNVQLVAANLNVGLEISTIVLTMFDARTRLAVDVADEVRSHFKEVVCRSIIPRSVRLSEAPSFGQPITVFDPSSRGAVAYRELAKEVSDGAPKRSG